MAKLLAQLSPGAVRHERAPKYADTPLKASFCARWPQTGRRTGYRGPVDERRTLILMRHGKSAYPDGVPDHERPLAPRGEREARLAGDWLRASTPAIDAVLCSTATRTRETLLCTGIDAPAQFLGRLYGATPGTVIDEINRVGDDVATLLIVGHEPTTSSVALILADPDGSNMAAAESISEKYPTSAIAVLDVPGRWTDVEPGSAALVEFHVPR